MPKDVSGIPKLYFKAWVGVRDAVSGYAGGTDTNPDYKKSAVEKRVMRNL